MDSLQIEFLGAAGEVTGSCYRLDTGSARFLVDCGMFHGSDADAKNDAALSFDVGALDFVIVTHAHIDHSGLLPRLFARGYRGPVYATPATIDLLGVMLPDSAHIQEKEAEWARERRAGAPSGGDASRRESRPAADAQRVAWHDDTGRPPRERRAGSPPAPLYTIADAEDSLRLLHPAGYGAMIAPSPSVRFCFRDAGHILGSAIVEAWIDGTIGTRKLVFSGDLGQPGRPVMDDPTTIAEADVLVVESTYGNRLHKTLATTYDEFARVLVTTLPRGNVVIPAFAVGRAQEVLHVLADLVRQGRAPDLTIFVDSPLAQRATAITAKYAATLDRESRDLTGWLAQHRDRVRVRFTETPQDSMAINGIRSGAVIVASGGMCEGGRIRHHLRHNLPREECAIVFTGFQAAGTTGRRIVDGALHVRLFREDVPVRAAVHTIGGLSAHADQAALLDWLSAFRAAPAQTFVVHGEQETALGFAQLIRERLRWTSVDVARHGERIALA